MAHSLNPHASHRSVNISSLRMFADSRSDHSEAERYDSKLDDFSNSSDFPLLVDSGVFELPEQAGPFSSFDIDSVMAGKDTLGSLIVDHNGRWCYSVYNIKLQFLKLGEKKMEQFSLCTEQGQLLTVFLTLIGSQGGATVKKVTTETSGF
ncbi:VCBS domain-containing protein [Vibrio sp.]|uniref:VCBS domain-containing protein n=1 Tax=Vibrio sp. TaxID=678 RepID=UPI00311F4937